MDVWRGFILVADIVKFSENSHATQIAMVQHLLAGLDDQVVLQPRNGRGPALISTGDGFILVVPSDGPIEIPTQFCELARHLVVHAKTFAGMEVRVGLHTGELTSDVSHEADKRFAVGTGLNWCARVADLAGPSQVLVSEELVDMIRSRLGGTGAQAPFFPPVDEPPWALTVKHKRVARIRAVLGEGLSEAPPPKLARAEQIGIHLRNALEIVGESLVVGLRLPEETDEAAMERLRPRLTVWVPHDAELRPIKPRVVLPPPGDEAEEEEALGSTVWSCRVGPQGPAGPIPAAFLSKQPMSLLGLPHRKDDKAGYFKRWAAYGVQRTTVEHFSRDAQAIIAIPLAIFEDAVGVLCIDLLDPLTGMDKVVDALADRLQLRSGYFIASLLHLRAA